MQRDVQSTKCLTEQKQAVSEFVHGRDVFVALLTGLPLVFGELFLEPNALVVVTPLVAIMKR